MKRDLLGRMLVERERERGFLLSRHRFHRRNGETNSRCGARLVNGLRRGADVARATLILILSNASVPGAD